MIDSEFQATAGRPRLKIKDTILDHILGYMSIILYIWTVLFTKFQVDSLPDFIPTHFKPDNTPDDHTISQNLYAFVFYQTVVCLLVYGLTKILHQLHYFREVNAENAGKQYLFGRIHLRVQKLITQVFLLYVEYQFIKNSTIGPIHISHTCIYNFICFIVLCLLIYFFVSKRYI